MAFGISLRAIAVSFLCFAHSAHSCEIPSEADFVEAALRHHLGEMSDLVWLSTEEGLVEFETSKYETTNDFMSAFPDCCERLPTGPEGMPLERLAGDFVSPPVGSVRIRYVVSYLLED